MIHRENTPGNGKGAGTQPMGGRGPGDWNSLLANDSPLQKGEPRAAVTITPISRRVLDSLVRQSKEKTGREEIIRMVKESGANLSREDIGELAGAISGSNAGVIWDCRLLGAILDNVEARPDIREVAVAVANEVKKNITESYPIKITTLDYDDATNICRAATVLEMPQMWDTLQIKMDWTARMAESFGKGTTTSSVELKREYLESWRSSIAAALEHNAPFKIVMYAAKQERGKHAIGCLWAAREFEAQEKELLVEKIDAMLEAGMPHISKKEIRKLPDVPESMQSELLWARMGEAFRALLKSEENKDHFHAMGILPVVPGKRRAQFVKAALESSVIPIADGISALCGMEPEFQSDELWSIASTEFAAMAKSGNQEWMKAAKEALRIIPHERKKEFLHEEGGKAAEEEPLDEGRGGKDAGEEAAQGNSTEGNGAVKKRRWGIFRLFG